MSDYTPNFVRGFSLHEALSMLEDDEIDADSIILFPPTNACGEITDEDSGDEEYVDINNLPASQMKSKVEITTQQVIENWSDEDEVPLSSFLEPKQQKKKIKRNYHYVKEDLPIIHDNFQIEENYSNIENDSPFEYFMKFIDDKFYEMVVEETNRYAAQKNKATRVDIFEIKCFIGILLLSGYVQLPRRRMYWETSSDTHNNMISQAMSRDKFEFIMSHIHFSDNTDKFAKVRPFFNELNKTFLENSYLEKHHSVDEAMVPYYGRHSCKQFIHGKPIRYGFKLWVGTTRQGYIIWFEPYQGASTNISVKYKELGVGAAVVLEYADCPREKYSSDVHFHIYFDNFFSSISLLENLTTKNMYGSGTIRENRIPQSILKDSKLLKKEPRGSYDYMKIENSNIIFIKWYDNNIVTFCSNVKGVSPLMTVKRYSQKDKKFINIEQPSVVKSYNNGMGGVDRSDQNISLYRTSIRGKKWYFSLISHCIDMAVHNAWQLYKHRGGKLDHLFVRQHIASTLLVQNKKAYVYQKGRRSVLKENQSLRYDGLHHLVIPQDKQTRCGACHLKTTTRCEKCDVGLHVKCFKMYHVK